MRDKLTKNLSKLKTALTRVEAEAGQQCHQFVSKFVQRPPPLDNGKKSNRRGRET